MDLDDIVQYTICTAEIESSHAPSLSNSAFHNFTHVTSHVWNSETLSLTVIILGVCELLASAIYIYSKRSGCVSLSLGFPL